MYTYLCIFIYLNLLYNLKYPQILTLSPCFILILIRSNVSQGGKSPAYLTGKVSFQKNMSIFKPCPIDDVASFGTTDRFGTMDLSGALEHVIFTQNLGKIPMFNYYMSQMDSNHHLQAGPLPLISHKWVMGPHKWPKINGFSWGEKPFSGPSTRTKSNQRSCRKDGLESGARHGEVWQRQRSFVGYPGLLGFCFFSARHVPKTPEKR